MSNMVCSNCRSVGKPKKITKGSLFIEIFLWLCFLIPGFIYSIWRMTTKAKVCPACGAPHMVPLNTPAGRDLSGG